MREREPDGCQGILCIGMKAGFTTTERGWGVSFTNKARTGQKKNWERCKSGVGRIFVPTEKEGAKQGGGPASWT